MKHSNVSTVKQHDHDDLPPIVSLRQEEIWALMCGASQAYVSFIWRMKKCLVVPRRETSFPSYARAACVSASRGWPVVVRSSGGAAVPNGPGILNLTIASYPSAPEMEEGYRLLSSVIIQALDIQGVAATTGSIEGSYCDGRYNVVIGGKKVAGTAQRWIKHPVSQRTTIISHAAISVDLDPREAANVVNGYYADLGIDSRVREGSISSLRRESCCPIAFESSLRVLLQNYGLRGYEGELYEHA